MQREVIHTHSAPDAIGPYSQAIRIGDTVYLSGQIPLDPETMTLVSGNRSAEIERVFENLSAVCHAAGGDLSHIAKLNIFLTNLDDFALVNEKMQQYFAPPYPARAAIGVAALPKGANVEMDAIMVLGQ